MALVGLDTERTRTLASTMAVAGDDLGSLRTEVDQTLALAQLESTVPLRFTAEATELDKVGAVLIARADLADGLEIDLKQLAAVLGISEEQAADAVAALASPDFDASAAPLLSLVGVSHYLFDDLPDTSRDVFVGLPPTGEDPELDAALGRLDGLLLPSILNGGSINPDDLTKQQQADLRVLAAALGGDEFTVRRTRTEKYAGAGGDDEYRKVTEDVAITDLGPPEILQFVTLSLQDGANFRRTTAEIARIGGANPSTDDVPQIAADLGITRQQATLMVEAAAIMGRFNPATLPSAGDRTGSGFNGEGVLAQRQRLREISEQLKDVELQSDRISLAGATLAVIGMAAFMISIPFSLGAVLAGAGFYTFVYDTVLDRRLEELREEERRRQEEQRRDRNGDGRYNSKDDDYDGDGISDAYDNDDDTGDPSGGHDGGV